MLRVEGDLPARSWLCREFIGRQSELDELQTSLELAANGNPQLVMLAGEAGLGKSRLVRALVEAHSSSDKLIFFGQGIPQTQALAFDPFLGAFRRYFSQPAKIQAGTQAGLAYLLHLMPDLAAFYPEVSPVNLERNGNPHQQRYQLFQTILNGLREMYQNSQTTLLLILEDLQWADEASLELLAFLARHLGVNDTSVNSANPERIFILGTYRSEELTASPALLRFLQQLTSQRRVHQIKLAPFDWASHTLMLNSMMGQPLPEELAVKLYEWGEGNPFFTEELLGGLAATRQVQPQEPGPKAPDSSLSLPLSLKSAIMERLAHLPATDREALNYAAVIGREFQFELLTALTELPETELLAVLRRAINSQLISEVSSDQFGLAANGEGERYRFRNALTREAIYSDMLARERRLRHRAVAEVLEMLSEGKAAASLARHYLKGGLAEKARLYALRMAEQSRRLLTAREERYYLQIALSSLPQGDQESLALLHRLGVLSMAIGDVPAALDYLTRARADYLQSGQPRRAATLSGNLSLLYWQYNPAKLGPLLEELENRAITSLEDSMQDIETLTLYSMVAFNLAKGKLYDRAAGWVEDAFALAESLANPLKVGALQFGLLARGMLRAEGHPGEIEAGLADIRQVLDFGLQNNLFELILPGYATLLATLTNLGFTESAEEVWRELNEFEARSGIATLAYAKGWHSFFAGDWEQGLDELRREEASANQAGAYSLNRVILAHSLIARNKLEEAGSYLEAALAKPEGLPVSDYLPGLWGLAKLHSAANRQDLAEAYYERLLENWKLLEDRSLVIPMLLDGVKFFADNNLHWKSRQWLNELQAVVAATGNRVGQAALYEAEGVVAMAEGAIGQAIKTLEQAALIWANLKRPYQQAQVHQRLATLILSQTGQDKFGREKADQLLQWAAKEYGRLQALTSLEEVEKLRQDYRLEMQSKRRATLELARSSFKGLTRREVQVLTQVSAGLTNKEIATELNISVGTVELHVNHILSKLNCESRTQAVTYAIEQGWTKPRLLVMFR